MPAGLTKASTSGIAHGQYQASHSTHIKAEHSKLVLTDKRETAGLSDDKLEITNLSLEVPFVVAIDQPRCRWPWRDAAHTVPTDTSGPIVATGNAG